MTNQLQTLRCYLSASLLGHILDLQHDIFSAEDSGKSSKGAG